ncbi:MAG TPA: hypothetical protein VFO85_05470 [Vicinamibacteria bacterium]|nr:hypothetical protein [Vicinamibacteria bacterium]
MKVATRDRGEIIHWAGFHHLSPGLQGEQPVLSGDPSPDVVRCGWEKFFAAMFRARLAMVYDPEDPASAAFVPEAEARPLRHEHASLRSAVEHSLRFLRVLFPRKAAAPDGKPTS